MAHRCVVELAHQVRRILNSIGSLRKTTFLVILALQKENAEGGFVSKEENHFNN